MQREGCTVSNKLASSRRNDSKISLFSDVRNSYSWRRLAGLFEIGGGYVVWQWWRNGSHWSVGLLGAVITDSVRDGADLSAVTLRPGLCRLRRLVHCFVDPLGMAGRSHGAGSIRCDRGDGVPGGCGSDDVLAEVKDGKELAWRCPALAQRAVADSPRWTLAVREPARPPGYQNEGTKE